MIQSAVGETRTETAYSPWTRRRVPPAELAGYVLPLIRRQARSLAQRLPPHVSVDDLVGAGTVALAELLATRSSMELDEFERLAAARARYAMLDELRAADPISRRLRQRARRITAATRDLHARLGRKPTEAEVSAHVGIPAARCRAALALAQASTAASLDAETGLDCADDRPSPEEAAGSAERGEILRDAVARLPERQRTIVQHYFHDELTLRQIGEIIGVTEARVSQLLSEAVRKLRTERTCRALTYH